MKMRAIFRRKPVEPPPTQDTQKHLERPSAQDIYEQVANNARQELGRSSISLAISGLAGGIFMGLSALGNAIAIALLTPAGTAPSTTTLFIAKMFYPLGFIVVILGRSQLFTENTLYPVALVLAEKIHFWNTMRLWAVVLPSNVLGALAFAALATLTNAVSPAVVQSFSRSANSASMRPTIPAPPSSGQGSWADGLSPPSPGWSPDRTPSRAPS